MPDLGDPVLQGVHIRDIAERQVAGASGSAVIPQQSLGGRVFEQAQQGLLAAGSMVGMAATPTADRRS